MKYVFGWFNCFLSLLMSGGVNTKQEELHLLVALLDLSATVRPPTESLTVLSVRAFTFYYWVFYNTLFTAININDI